MIPQGVDDILFILNKYDCVDEEEEDEEELRTDEERRRDDFGGGGYQSFKKEYQKRWGWQSVVDSISEKRRITWEQVYDMNIIEFLNMMCYIKDSSELERLQRDEWMNRRKI